MSSCTLIDPSETTDFPTLVFQSEAIFGKNSPLAELAANHLMAFTGKFRFFHEQIGALYQTLELSSPLRPGIERYLNGVDHAFDVLSPQSRPNPKAAYWPDPRRDPLNTVEASLPYMLEYGLFDQSTPIVSAGSCFASEIARELQMRYFNYVITEAPHEPEFGVHCQDFEPTKPLYPFSANWGLLFNTPSYLQLVEKAFEIKDTPHLVFKLSEKFGRYSGMLMDPFRQNIFFENREAYETNYEKHRKAARDAILQAEVFVLTFGLNECWEFIADGSVLTTWPNYTPLLSLVKPKVLTFEENIQKMQEFIDIVRAHNSRVKFIVSVSPVPFAFTVRMDQHVITANTHSKSMLRVVADDLVQRNKNVFYMPSYEMVTRCVPNPWSEDQRHVHSSAIERVMELFLQMFAQKSPLITGQAPSKDCVTTKLL